MKHLFCLFTVLGMLGCGASQGPSAAEDTAPDTLSVTGILGEEFGDSPTHWVL